MAATLVQKNKAYPSTTIAYSSPVTKNNTLIVCVSAHAAADTISIMDNQSNIWTKVVSLMETYGSTVNAAIFSAIANGNNTPTITITGGTGFSDSGGAIFEYSGLSVITDGTSSANVVSTNTPTANSITTTVTDVVIAMCAQEDHSGTFNASSGGFTLQEANNGHVDAESDAQNVTAGSYACVFSFVGTGNPWIVLQAAFKVGSNGGTNRNFLAFM